MRLNIPLAPFEMLGQAISLAVRTKMLQDCLADGSFHHSTFRTESNMYGLYIYVHQDNGFNGFTLLTGFSRYDGDALERARNLVASRGVYEGSYR
jgi:hypothetical protein